MFLPHSIQDWIPENHIVRFVCDMVETLPTIGFRVNPRGSGSEQYQPRMLLALLIYCYATGRFHSREIEQATYSDVAVRFICGGDLHPDHSTIAEFRMVNRALFESSFVKVLELASATGVLKKVGTVSVDGTKIPANASRHAAVSYQRAEEMIKVLEAEVRQLLLKVEEADSKPLADGLSLPQELSRREDRKKRLEEARRIIEQRHEEQRAKAQEEYERKKAVYEEKKRQGQRRGAMPKPPPTEPPAKAQHNFTDPESRIMPAGSGKDGFIQGYNCQAAVDAEGSRLVLGCCITQNANDKQELIPTVASVPPEIRTVNAVLTDNGFCAEAAVTTLEASGTITVYSATERQSHHRSVADLEKQDPPAIPGPEASFLERMRYRLATPEGRARYQLRKETVEPIFGIIKEVMGFRRFNLRGRDKVELEWGLVTLAYNVRRLFRLGGCNLLGKGQLQIAEA